MDRDSKFWLLRREPLILMALSAIAAVFFTLVVFLSKSYQRQQEKLGRDLSNRGSQEFQLHHFDTAALDYRAALHYSRDNPIYQLHLAQALAALNRPDEAYTYLQDLLERQPNDGTVNLALAHIEIARGKMDQAVRYFHNAIYGNWPDNQDASRRKAWLELIQLFLNNQSLPQARAELIALSSSLPEDPRSHQEIADLFFRAEDYEHALESYQAILKTNERDESTLFGAGRSAFAFGRYALAESYLQDLLRVNPQNAEAVQLLQTSDLVIKYDPFTRRLSDTERSQRVLQAFAVAGKRIQSCLAPGQTAATNLSSLASRWSDLKTKLNPTLLRREAPLRDSTMDLVFAIEQQTDQQCGTATGDDLALLLISQDRERAEP
jgi:tetratricopeptide (TPR) repeat protein